MSVQNTPSQIRIPLVLAIGLAAGLFVGVSLNGTQPSNEVGNDAQKLKEVLTYIDQKYVDKVQTEELVDDAIQHLLTKLDPHSSYLPVADLTAAKEQLQGNFDGIGIEFNIFQDTIVVVAPLSGGPSEALGIQSGDKIVEVEGKNVAGVGITSPQVLKLLKGPRGTKVNVGIKRGSQSELLDFEITRDKIPQNSVDASYMVNDEVGYIKVSRFAATTDKEFDEALAKLKRMGMTKLVLDLQGNPGGYMHIAIGMADEFLKAGKKIVYTDGKDKSLNTNAYSTERGKFEEGELIVLVNEGSASASEIVSGALQDNDRALVVGRRTYGKGLVQTPFDLSDGSELLLTISRYYTPSGRSIQKPYEDEELYALDIIDRFKHGEFFHADSIKFNDSLKYYTVNGRSVYGGGGIMPDYFVPLDTAQNSHYFVELITSTTLQEFAFNYANENKEKLEAQGFENYHKNFTVSDRMLEDLVQMGIRNGVKADRKELNKKKYFFQVQVKALIARRIWGENGMYPILNETNEIFVQAMKLFDKIPSELNRSDM